MSNFKSPSTIFSLLVMILLFSRLVWGFTEPSFPPPSVNVPAPLNVGSQGQSKSGGLILNTGGAAYGLIVDKGNVGIGTVPASSALLDLTSTSKGLLPPRMTTTQRDTIASPTAGLLIYNTTTNGYNLYNGTSWGVVGGGDAGWAATGNDIYNTNSGNVGIGTTNPTTGKLVVTGGSLDVSFNKIINVLTPTLSGDATNKGYVDAQVSAASPASIFYLNCGWTTASANACATVAPVGSCTAPSCPVGTTDRGTGCEVTSVSYSGSSCLTIAGGKCSRVCSY